MQDFLGTALLTSLQSAPSLFVFCARIQPLNKYHDLNKECLLLISFPILFVYILDAFGFMRHPIYSYRSPLFVLPLHSHNRIGDPDGCAVSVRAVDVHQGRHVESHGDRRFSQSRYRYRSASRHLPACCVQRCSDIFVEVQNFTAGVGGVMSSLT